MPSKKNLNCLFRAAIGVVPPFITVSLKMTRLYYYRFLSLLFMNQVAEKTISWLLTVYNKNKMSSQCNLTAQMEPVQDKAKINHIF